MTDVSRQHYLQTEGLIPDKITCPNCGQEITEIVVKEAYGLFWNGGWHYSDPDQIRPTYYCSECDEELPDSEGLGIILESAER